MVGGCAPFTITGSLATGTIQDDGDGLLQSDRQVSVSPNHLGINGMIERARLAGGDVTINSTPGQGVKVDFSFPIAGVEPADH